MTPIYTLEADVHPAFLQAGPINTVSNGVGGRAATAFTTGAAPSCSSAARPTAEPPTQIRAQEAAPPAQTNTHPSAARASPQRWSLGDLSLAEAHQNKLMQQLSSTCELHRQAVVAEQPAWVASSFYRCGSGATSSSESAQTQVASSPAMPSLIEHRASCDSSACTFCHRRSLSIMPCEAMYRKRSFGDRRAHRLKEQQRFSSSATCLSRGMVQTRSENDLAAMAGCGTASFSQPCADDSDDMDIDEQDDFKRRRSISQLGWMHGCRRSQATQSWGRAVEEEVRGTATPARASFTRVCELTPGEASSVVNSGQLAGSSTKHIIQDLAVKENGIHMAGATRAKQVCIYDVYNAIQEDSNQSQAPVICHKMPARVCCMSWSPSSDNLLTMGDHDGVLWQMDVSSGHVVHEIDEHSGDRIWSVAHSKHHPAIVAAASGKACVSLWDTTSGHQAGKICLQNRKMPVCSVEFSPFAEHLMAVASADHGVYLYDLRNPTVPCQTLSGHKRPVSYVRFMSQDRLVSSSIDGMVMLWDGVGGASHQPRIEKVFQDHVNHKNFVGLSVNNNGLIACGSEDGAAYTYFPSWKEKLAVTNSVGPDKGFVTSVAWINTDNLGIPLQDCPPMLAVGNTLGGLELLALIRHEGHQSPQMAQ